MKNHQFIVYKLKPRGFGKKEDQFVVYSKSIKTKEKTSTALVLNTSSANPQTLSLEKSSKVQFQEDQIHKWTHPSILSVEKDTSIPFFVGVFYLILSEILGLHFELQHFFAMSWIFEDFVLNNMDLNLNVKFHPEHIHGFTRNYTAIKTKLNQAILLNTRQVNYFGNKISVKDFKDILFQRISLKKKYYYRVCQVASMQNMISGFHLLYHNVVWYSDVTEVEQLGNGVDKSTGPNLLIFLESSSKKIVHWILYPSKKELKLDKKDRVIKSKNIVQEVKKISLNSHKLPMIIHMDSDAKNRSLELFYEFYQLNVIPSFNKTSCGTLYDPHLNQVLEKINDIYKNYLAQIIENNNLPMGSLQYASLEDKKIWIQRAVDYYNNKSPHRGICTIDFDYKNRVEVSPNEADEAHQLFDHLFCCYCTIKNHENELPSSVSILVNRNVESEIDRQVFVEYVAKHLLTVYISSSDLKNLEKLIIANAKGSFCVENHNKVINVFNLLFSYFLANSTNTGLQNFFNNNFQDETIGIAGPGRKRKFTDEYKNMMYTKQDFYKSKNFHIDLLFQILGRLFQYFFVFRDRYNAQFLVEVTSSQTQELKAHSEGIAKQFKRQIGDLKTEVNQLNNQLQVFYDKEKRLAVNRDKKKKRQKRPITPAIKLSQFLVCLKITHAQSIKTNSFALKFSYARNRIALFLLYFSGMRVGSLREVSFDDLFLLFKENHQIAIPDSKKREAKDELVFAVSKSVRQKFLFGSINLFDDFQFLINHFDKWADNQNILISQRYQHKFFTTDTALHKPVSRVSLTNTINEIVRKAVEAEGTPHSKIQTFSSHSFRINLVTKLINRFGLRVAQSFIRHKSTVTTALYDRNVLSFRQMKSISEVLCLDKPLEKFHPDSSKFNDMQLTEIANFIAINENMPNLLLDTNNPFESVNRQILPNFSKVETTMSDEISDLEDQSLIIEDHQNEVIDTTFVDLNKTEKLKRHLKYKTSASKKKKTT